MPVVVAIITTTVLGIPIALAIDRNAKGPILLGLSYLYGTGLIYAVELTLAVAGIHWSALNVTAIAIVIAAICLVARKPSTNSSVLSPQSSVLDLATVATVILYANYATLARVWEWDFWAIWGLKASTFFDARTIDWRFLESGWNEFAHPDYPLLLPLNYAYTALLGGAWDDRWLGLIGLAFGISLLVIVRGMAALETTPRFAAVITFACTVFALSRFIGLAEAPMIAFAGAGLLFVRRAIVFDDNIAMRHGALLLGLAAATKNEGIALLVTVVVALAITRWRLIPRLWPAAVVAGLWFAVRALHHFPTDLTRGSFFSRLFYRLGAIESIAAMLLQNLPLRWLWLAILLAVLVVPRELRARERFVLIAVTVQILFYIAVYCATPYQVEWHIGTSWPRLTFQLATPLLYVVMATLAAYRRDHC
jgi:hypothetical protein